MTYSDQVVLSLEVIQSHLEWIRLDFYLAKRQFTTDKIYEYLYFKEERYHFQHKIFCCKRKHVYKQISHSKPVLPNLSLTQYL